MEGYRIEKNPRTGKEKLVKITVSEQPSDFEDEVCGVCGNTGIITELGEGTFCHCPKGRRKEAEEKGIHE
jgi:hypothetical protein